MKLRIFLAICISVFLFGCNQPKGNGISNGTAWASGLFNSNGKQIYFTATSKQGTPISYQGGPTTGMMMMGGNFACVSCHGTDARGGSHVMHMETMVAPDIRWTTLSTDHDHGGVGHTDAEQAHNEAYTFENFMNAVEKGKHPDGDELSKDMPRWKMSEADLRDLMEYLKSL
ncbi:MAG: cytochrome c [Paludibacter sp.]|nr:cytochrome c [Paludibacter sp.]